MTHTKFPPEKTFPIQPSQILAFELTVEIYQSMLLGSIPYLTTIHPGPDGPCNTCGPDCYLRYAMHVYGSRSAEGWNPTVGQQQIVSPKIHLWIGSEVDCEGETHFNATDTDRKLSLFGVVLIPPALQTAWEAQFSVQSKRHSNSNDSYRPMHGTPDFQTKEDRDPYCVGMWPEPNRRRDVSCNTSRKDRRNISDSTSSLQIEMESVAVDDLHDTIKDWTRKYDYLGTQELPQTVTTLNETKFSSAEPVSSVLERTHN